MQRYIRHVSIGCITASRMNSLPQGHESTEDGDTLHQYTAFATD